MAKELPYFRFTAAEWLNGDISLEATYLKGVFIDICAYYWFKDCSITKALLKKKFTRDFDAINDLIKLEILKHDVKSDFLCINFLNDQYDVLSKQRKSRQIAGSKGGKQKSSNAKANTKQSSSYKDKDKDKDKENNKDKDKEEKIVVGKPTSPTKTNIIKIQTEKKQSFKKWIIEEVANTNYLNQKDELNRFYEYWVEAGPQSKKLRWEKETAFDIKRRLITWFNNNYNEGSKAARRNNSTWTKKPTKTEQAEEWLRQKVANFDNEQDDTGLPL